MTRFLAAALFALAVLHPAAAGPPGNCGPAAVLHERMGAEFKETMIGVGVIKGGDLLEIFATDDQTAWTIVAVTGSNIACIVLAGTSLEIRRPGEGI